MSSQHRVLDQTDTNMLIQHTDGTVENISLSPLNKLLYDHNLWGLLKEGSEILQVNTEHRNVTIIPDENARKYTLEVGSTEPLQLGEHQKSDLVNALMDAYEDGDCDPTPLIELYDNLRADMVRERVVNFIGETAGFTKDMEIREDGWFINGKLLLTWDNEFLHPGTTSRNLTGGIVNAASTEHAYVIQTDRASTENRNIKIEGEKYRLTDSEMEFISRAIWGIKQTPKNSHRGA